MAPTLGLVPITRAYLSSYYDKYPLVPLSSHVADFYSQLRSLINDFCSQSPITPDEKVVVDEVDCQVPHKIDENMWKNRENLEEIIYLLDRSHWPAALQQQATEDPEFATVLDQLRDKFEESLKNLQYFQTKNSDSIFNTGQQYDLLLRFQVSLSSAKADLTFLLSLFDPLSLAYALVMSYMPQDFRGTLIRQQKERSERNKQAEIDALVKSGCSIRDRYALLWKQQMERRRQLAQLGSATGVYKTLVKYLVGVPQRSFDAVLDAISSGVIQKQPLCVANTRVLLDFIQQLNDDEGPMEEQRQRYGPPLYSLTKMLITIRVFLFLLWARVDTQKMTADQLTLLEGAANTYTCEFERFITFMGEVFANSPFFISADEVGVSESRNDDYKEISIPAGKTHEVLLSVDSLNSYIAWDFALEPSKMKMDVGFSVEYTDSSGQNILILPYRRCESDQGNFCTVMAGTYKLIWDNSYSTFFGKALHYKVDCIPPVVEPVPQ